MNEYEAKVEGGPGWQRHALGLDEIAESAAYWRHYVPEDDMDLAEIINSLDVMDNS